MLLFRILELWTITHILVDAGTHWQMFLIPDSPESNSDENRPLNPEQPLPIDQDNNPRNYEVIGSQLRAATEQKASVFSKAILNDFERRLLQRSQCQGFETFLAAVILLSCVEKMCWLYQTWDDEQLTAKVSRSTSFHLCARTLTISVAARQSPSSLYTPRRVFLGSDSHAPQNARRPTKDQN